MKHYLLSKSHLILLHVTTECYEEIYIRCKRIDFLKNVLRDFIIVFLLSKSNNKNHLLSIDCETFSKFPEIYQKTSLLIVIKVTVHS